MATLARSASALAQALSAELAKAVRSRGRAVLEALPGRCELLIKDDEMLWRFMNDDDIPLTNNEAERALRGYVLWRKDSYGVCSHRGN
jgi:hypothetical protein